MTKKYRKVGQVHLIDQIGQILLGLILSCPHSHFIMGRPDEA